MPHLDPLPLTDIRDSEFRLAAQAAQGGAMPGSWFVRLLARSPEHGKALLSALDAVNHDGLLGARLKELVRILLADVAGDQYFGIVRSGKARDEGVTDDLVRDMRRKYDSDTRFSDRERCALRFAEQMFTDAQKIDDAWYAELRAYFSEPEIVELGSFIVISYGLCRITEALAVTPSDDAT
jgi:alkylhydroperoxidase family enzyme